MQKSVINIFALAKALREHIATCRDMDLSFPQLKALGMIATKPEATMKDIATTLMITSPSATEIIDKLVESGYLKREVDKSDKRVKRLSITPKGKVVLDKGLKIATDKMEELSKPLTKQEKKTLATLLEKIQK